MRIIPVRVCEERDLAVRELRREAALFWDVASKIWAGVWLLLLGPVMLMFTAIRDEWGVVIYFAWIIFGAVVALVVGRRPKHLRLYLGSRRVPIVIEAADIFSGDGVKIIPVNEYFDGEVGDHVSISSLHGQFIDRVCKRLPDRWDSILRVGLANVEPVDSVSRSSGRTDQYSIGTWCRVPDAGPGQEYILVALSRTDVYTLQATANIDDLYCAVAAAVSAAKQCANGRPVDFPLIGGGLSRTSLHASELLDILLEALIREDRRGMITEKIRIVLDPDVLRCVDLRDINRRWK